VFKAEISLVDSSALGQPGFELAGGFDYIHAGNDSGGEKRKSNDGESCSPPFDSPQGRLHHRDPEKNNKENNCN
jgi:hypothetical protein